MLSLVPFYVKSSKKLDGLLKIIGIGLAISGVNFWIVSKDYDEPYIFASILVVRPSVFLMTFMGAEACLKLIEGQKLMFSIASKLISAIGMAYLPVYFALCIAPYIKPIDINDVYYTFIWDIYLTVISQIVLILLVESSLFASQYNKKYFLMLSMIPSFVVIIVYAILEVMYKSTMEAALNREKDKDPYYYCAAMCYCILISCGIIPGGFILVQLNILNNRENGTFQDLTTKEPLR